MLERHGFSEVRRRGSHIVMQRVKGNGNTKQALNHFAILYEDRLPELG